jgi:hypothetical protein
VPTLAGSVTRRGALPWPRDRLIRDHALARLEDTMLWSSTSGIAGSGAGSARRLVRDAEAEWWLPPREAPERSRFPGSIGST